MPALDTMGKALGISVLIETLKREVPDVEIGNFSRPVQRKRSVEIG